VNLDEAVRRGRVLLLGLAFLATILQAQPATTSVTKIPYPFVGPVTFDAAGNMYYFGAGGSESPVTAGAAQTQSGGGLCQIVINPFGLGGNFPFSYPCQDAWAAKLDTSGNLVFGTLLGGPDDDRATALAIDSAGNVFLAGFTGGSFPTTSGAAIQGSTTANSFAAKVSADGSRFVYSTYLPDAVWSVSAIAIDGQGNAYLAGQSAVGHIYVLKLSANGSAFAYNVSLAGSNQGAADAIAADSFGNAIVVGHTSSPDFPVSAGAVQNHLAGTQNVFVTKLSPNGTVLFSTYLGGSGADAPTAVKIDAAGNIYVAGQTSSADFPTTPGSLQPAPAVPLWSSTGPGGFAAKLSADGSALVWSTYVMSIDNSGSGQRGVTQLAVTSSGESYLAGVTGVGFPITASAPQPCLDADLYYTNAFVAHIDPQGGLLDATYVGQNAGNLNGLSLAGDGSVLLPWYGTYSTWLSRIRFGGAGWSAPACLSPSVLNAATQTVTLMTQPGGVGSVPSPVAPGEVITLTGFGIGPDVGVTYQPDKHGGAPRELGGVQVLFDGQPAPVLYVQSRQINAVAPVELIGKTQTAINVVYRDITVGSIQASVSIAGMPGIFRLQPNTSTQAFAFNQDGTLNGPSNPAARGSIVSLLGTGFGLTDPACADGSLNPAGPVNLGAAWTASIYDTSSRFIAASSAAGAPGLLCGMVTISLPVPTTANPGDYLFFPRSDLYGGEAFIEGQAGATIVVK
jgi:uncharacterized protein (TIGR03437 family)